MTNNSKHVTSENVGTAQQSSNPLSDGLNITVSVPESVDIKLVNASALTDFEIWIYISSILSNAVVGFWISDAQNTVTTSEKILWWISLVFSLLFGISLLVAFLKRLQLSRKSKKYTIKNEVQ
jgi:nitric oxide reductase large subunit